MHPFRYVKPELVDDACSILERDEGGRPLAGGMSLLPMMKLRLAGPSTLVDLKGIGALRGISMAQGFLRIGAITRHHDVATSPEVQARIPALSKLAQGIGDVQVRHRGTIGGSVANSDPAADYPSAILALDAKIVTSRRTIAADDFFTGLFATALQSGEIITHFEFPVPRAAHYEKFANQASRFAIVGVFVSRTGDKVRVAVTGASTHVFRCEPIEQALTSNFAAGAIEAIEMSPRGLTSDIHSPAEYRAHLIRVLAMKAVQKMS